MANEQLIEELIALARRTADDTLLDIMPMVRGLLNDLAAALESCERERAALQRERFVPGTLGRDDGPMTWREWAADLDMQRMELERERDA